nr:hypothetical protein GCM10020093_007990 [Planobispora longispora]
MRVDAVGHGADLGLLERGEADRDEVLVVLLPRRGGLERRLELGEVLRGRLGLGLADGPHHLPDVALLPGLQQGQLLGVAAFEHAQELAAEAAQPVGQVLRPAVQEAEPVVRDRRRQPGRDLVGGQPGRGALTRAITSAGGSNRGSGRLTPMMSRRP